MKGIITACAIGLAILLSCRQYGIKYELYSGGELVFEIYPKDIEFYDTTQYRGYIEIHEMRLKEGFYNQDSFVLKPPLELICKIGGERYFWADFFQQAQSQPRLWVNFKFRSSCDNVWTFQEQEPGKLILRTKNKCNSIEFFHSKKEIEQSRESYYEKKGYFRNYVDTARLAHEILLDPFYLRALEDNGVPIK